MWEPMGVVFLCAIMAAMVDWLKQAKHQAS